MVRAFPLTAAAALLVLAACTPSTTPQPLTAADSTAVTKLQSDYVAAWNRGDVDGVVRLYADTATVMLPDTAPLVGSNAMRTFLNTTLGTPRRPVLALTSSTMLGRQDLAVLMGTYTLTVPADTAAARGTPAPSPVAGHYLDAITKQADGTWKILYHAISYDAPLVMPAPAPARRRR